MRRIRVFHDVAGGEFRQCPGGHQSDGSPHQEGRTDGEGRDRGQAQLEKTLASYNTIVDGKAADPKASYKDLGKAVKDSEDRVADVTKRKEEMDVEAAKLFDVLEDERGRHLQSRIEEEEPGEAGGDAGPLREDRHGRQGRPGEYDAFLTGLKDQITFMGHDLNPAALASLKPDAAKLNDRAKKMFEKIDGASAAANASIDGMRQK